MDISLNSEGNHISPPAPPSYSLLLPLPLPALPPLRAYYGQWWRRRCPIQVYIYGGSVGCSWGVLIDFQKQSSRPTREIKQLRREVTKDEVEDPFVLSTGGREEAGGGGEECHFIWMKENTSRERACKLRATFISILYFLRFICPPPVYLPSPKPLTPPHHTTFLSAPATQLLTESCLLYVMSHIHMSHESCLLYAAAISLTQLPSRTECLLSGGDRTRWNH